MTPTRTIRAFLIAGHAAVAMLGLAALQASAAVPPVSAWREARTAGVSAMESPRRVPARRAGREAFD